jgi:pilus assembly protein CpaE
MDVHCTKTGQNKSTMIRAAVISIEPGISDELCAAILSSRTMSLIKPIDHLPDADELRRAMRLTAPEVVFLNHEDRETAGKLSRFLANSFPAIQQIGVIREEDPTALRFALELRMADLISAPFAASLEAVADRVANHLERHPSKMEAPGHLYAFLPAKGGAGASTLAANVSWAMAAQADNSVLLADLDFHCGVTDFMFNTEHEFTVGDAIVKGADLDGDYWQRMVARVGKIDLLLSCKPAFDHTIPGRYLIPVLEFARKMYSTVNVDLSSTLDELTVTALREATRIFVVTTTDLASLRVCRKKVRTLRELDLADKAVLVLNRVEKRMNLSIQQIESMIDLPVFATFPNEYADVTRAIREAQPSAKLAADTKKFVKKLSGKGDQPRKRNFIEFFSVRSIRRWSDQEEPLSITQGHGRGERLALPAAAGGR